MKTSRFITRRRGETGSIVVFAAVALVALFGIAALTFDVVRYCQQKRDLQSATDAAALAGALVLTNSSPSVASIQAYATAVATNNGIRGSELTAITAGQWTTNGTGVGSFTAGPPYNAVLVSAQRTFPTTFGAVLGTSNMVPAVQSVAMLSYPSAAQDLIPFMLTSDYATLTPGTQVTITQHDYKSDGDFGKAVLGSLGYIAGMTDGCGCTVNIGQNISADPGNAHVEDGLADAAGRIVIVPVVSALPQSNGSTPVIGFAAIYIDSESGNGNWTATFTILGTPAGIGSSTAPTGALYAKDRILVE